jgi:glycosyltransferase 2 family protein
MLFGLVGLALATTLILWQGATEILGFVAKAGWSGVLLASLYYLFPMAIAAYGWWLLLPGRRKVPWTFLYYVAWVRSSVNNMMPVARIGGEIVAARLLMKQGVRRGPAIASVVVETTVSVISVFLFVVLGVSLFIARVGADQILWQLAAAVLFSVPIIILLLAIQKFGFFGLLAKIFRAMFRNKWTDMAGTMEKLDRAVHVMYRRRRRVLLCTFYQFLAWLLGSGQIYLALLVLGHPISFAEAMMIEALIQATSSAAFLIPGALGAQEAAFLVFGQMMGLTPEMALALALMRRAKDIIIYGPGLIAWQIQEGRWLLKKKA